MPQWDSLFCSAEWIFGEFGYFCNLKSKRVETVKRAMLYL